MTKKKKEVKYLLSCSIWNQNIIAMHFLSQTRDWLTLLFLTLIILFYKDVIPINVFPTEWKSVHTGSQMQDFCFNFPMFCPLRYLNSKSVDIIHSNNLLSYGLPLQTAQQSTSEQSTRRYALLFFSQDWFILFFTDW